MSTYRKQVPQSTGLLGAEKHSRISPRARKSDLLPEEDAPGGRFRKRCDTVITCATKLSHWRSVNYRAEWEESWQSILQSC